MNSVVAIVGTSFSGKSMLLRELSVSGFDVIDEYCVYAGGNRNFRKIPFKNALESEENIKDFLRLERLRQKDILLVKERNDNSVITDRSLFCVMLTQLMIRMMRPDWHNAFCRSVELVKESCERGDIVLPARLIILEPANEATFLARSQRGVSVGLFSEVATWKFFSRYYKLIAELLYGQESFIRLFSSNTRKSAELVLEVEKFLQESHKVDSEVLLNKWDFFWGEVLNEK
ncbi:MAG: hypothetical protein NT098_02350 [Candidatus Parcubacteria bacterium]|nr:hypothetical protein [Candidatus Parcubacteria bacterium]